MTKNYELTPRQKRAIAAFLCSKILGEACKLAGISRSTLARWMDDPQFKIELSAAERQFIHETSLSLMSSRDEALGVLRHLMISGNTESNQRQTALDLIDLLLRFHGAFDFEEQFHKND